MKVSLRRTIAIRAAYAAVMRGLLVLFTLSLVVTAAAADPLKVAGQLGFLGEWKLTADLTESGQNGQREFAGPYILKHVGLCTHDGPEEKAGQMRLKILASPARVMATLLVDGAECTYSAGKSSGYDGALSCPSQSPVTLILELTSVSPP
jgi:hypothetical protein